MFKRILLISAPVITLLLIAGYFILDYTQEPHKMDHEARSKAGGQIIPLSQGNVHYQMQGPENGELVVLVHGGMVSGTYAWEKNYQALIDAGFKVLRYDLYGRGYSDRVKQDYTPSLLFNQFEELVDSLNIQDPFYLVGLSLGSMVAINFADQHPEMVKELVLISPAALGKANIKWPLKIPVVSDILMTTYWAPQSVESQMNEFYRPDSFPEYEDKIREMMKYKGYKDSNLSTWNHTLTYSMRDALNRIGKRRQAVTIILGKHDPYVTLQETNDYQQMIPDLKVHIIENAGHVVNFENPEAFNTLLLEALASDYQKDGMIEQAHQINDLQQ